MRPIAAALVLLTGVGVLAACGGSGSGTPSGAAQNAVPTDYAGVTNEPPQPAPPLELVDSLGKRVDIADYRGKAVLVTFMYEHCAVCSRIIQQLRAAQNRLGAAARRLQIIAVSVNPQGDSSKAINRYLAEHHMTGRMEYLVGSRSELKDVWADWNLVTGSHPGGEVSEAVDPVALVYGISASGRVTTLYPGNFRPQQIVHDVPRLAGS
jgi:protein SCO1/2